MQTEFDNKRLTQLEEENAKRRTTVCMRLDFRKYPLRSLHAGYEYSTDGPTGFTKSDGHPGTNSAISVCKNASFFCFYLIKSKAY